MYQCWINLDYFSFHQHVLTLIFIFACRTPQNVDISSNFYFSYTYDLTRPLQQNMHITTEDECVYCSERIGWRDKVVKIDIPRIIFFWLTQDIIFSLLLSLYHHVHTCISVQFQVIRPYAPCFQSFSVPTMQSSRCCHRSRSHVCVEPLSPGTSDEQGECVLIS